MILCDIGNTSYHFLDGTKDYKKSSKSFNPQSIKEKVYYICVNKKISKILNDLDNWIDISTKIELSKYYPTIGIDRAVACEVIFDGVIVDAGSAITVDVKENGQYLGGFIYPGIKAISKTYKDISNVLDYELNYDVDMDQLPKNSQDAISYGFLKLFSSEVISYKKEIILTGGDAEKLLALFPTAKVDTKLLFKGMKSLCI